MVRIFGPRFNGPVRGTDFRYGFWSGLEPGTVRGTDFGTKKSVPERIFSERYVVRTKISKN